MKFWLSEFKIAMITTFIFVVIIEKMSSGIARKMLAFRRGLHMSLLRPSHDIRL